MSSPKERVEILRKALQETLSGIRVVKAFSQQKEESLKFSTDAKKLYNEQVSAARQQAINMPLMTFLLGLPTALVLWYGGRQVIDNTLTIGGVTQFILYLGMLAMPIRRLGFVANMFSRSMSAGQRILEILDADARSPDVLPKCRHSGYFIADFFS
jgi:ABC-type multidrug transport system fused ATPase/permease subunit